MASAFNIVYHNQSNIDVNFKLYCMGGTSLPWKRNLPQYWWNHCPAGTSVTCPVDAATVNLGTIFDGIGAVVSLGVAAGGLVALVLSLGAATPVVVPLETAAAAGATGAAAGMTAADAGAVLTEAASAAAAAEAAGAGVAAAAGDTVNLAVINAPVAEALAAGEPVASLPPWWTGLYTKAALLAYGKMLVGIGGIACIISALASEKLMFGYELGCAAALSNGKDAPPDAAGHTQLFYAKKNLVIQNNDWHIHFTGPVNSDWLPGK